MGRLIRKLAEGGAVGDHRQVAAQQGAAISPLVANVFQHLRPHNSNSLTPGECNSSAAASAD
ncbi:MAG TPA: hypothetical protein VG939_06940 [Caulobacteraceae bacterium]|nr:hypothetical protein [Caulobacteraceae bacterium]